MKTRKIQCVVKSTQTAETLALEEALQECYMIRLILLEMFKKELNSKLFPIYFYTNRSLLDSMLKADVCIIQEIVGKKKLNP